jgi:hypothetical protein
MTRTTQHHFQPLSSPEYELADRLRAKFYIENKNVGNKTDSEDWRSKYPLFCRLEALKFE